MLIPQRCSLLQLTIIFVATAVAACAAVVSSYDKAQHSENSPTNAAIERAQEFEWRVNDTLQAWSLLGQSEDTIHKKMGDPHVWWHHHFAAVHFGHNGPDENSVDTYCEYGWSGRYTRFALKNGRCIRAEVFGDEYVLQRVNRNREIAKLSVGRSTSELESILGTPQWKDGPINIEESDPLIKNAKQTWIYDRVILRIDDDKCTFAQIISPDARNDYGEIKSKAIAETAKGLSQSELLSRYGKPTYRMLKNDPIENPDALYSPDETWTYQTSFSHVASLNFVKGVCESAEENFCLH